MAEILKPKVEATGILDIVGMLAAKRIIDGVALPVVGNNNLMSAVAKLGVGAMTYGKGGRLGKVATGGLILDGADDVASMVMARIGGVGNGGQVAAVNPGL